ncbi:Gamma-glutamyl hydrolase 2 [Vitis vinifera]|uniref:Gamma-glutamyl hydrolase 2 n=1 Tax=Vitis vinifera TaxID=29760 RepID=A0A438E5R8_VITVI|nr:Gamma-glutamyl hydrolase 2 [Vitis vinifera]
MQKNAFEWGLSRIPHSEDAVQVTQHVANFFYQNQNCFEFFLTCGCSEARKSLNRPPARKVLDNLIYNYSPTYCGKAGKLKIPKVFRYELLTRFSTAGRDMTKFTSSPEAFVSVKS